VAAASTINTTSMLLLMVLLHLAAAAFKVDGHVSADILGAAAAAAAAALPALCVCLGFLDLQQPFECLIAHKAYRILRYNLDGVGSPAPVEAPQTLLLPYAAERVHLPVVRLALHL
jgi:hypothetical protein